MGKHKRLLRSATISVFALSSLVTACVVDDSPQYASNAVAYDEFMAKVYKEPWVDGVYIVNGDTPVAGEKQLMEMWQQMQHGQLAVDTTGGNVNKWSDTQKRNLTYCVSNSFGANKAKVVEGIRQATENGWEKFANVNFVYLSAQDANCTATNNNVVFDVRPVSGASYAARAFFPNQPRSQRNVLIDSSQFGPNAWKMENLMAHEIGHTLGFRHEHTRPEAGACFEDRNYQALTAYDSGSTMHYPACNGTNRTMAFSTLDAQGAAALYGAPGQSAPPSATTTKNFSGAVAQNEFVYHQMAVKAGKQLSVQMTGSGDADLYVRFGAIPTTAKYDCRPYLDNSNEQCVLTVPSGQTTAFIAIHGYTVANYQIVATN